MSDVPHVHDGTDTDSLDGPCCECGGAHCCCECPAFIAEVPA